MQKIRTLKAMRRSGSKQSMLGLFEWSLWEGTDALDSMSKLIFVQKISHFEVLDFGSISYKETDKIDILRCFKQNVSALSIFVQISWNLHQMTITYSRVSILGRQPAIVAIRQGAEAANVARWSITTSIISIPPLDALFISVFYHSYRGEYIKQQKQELLLQAR